MWEFRAAVLREYGMPLSIERVSIDALGDYDVLVKMKAAGLCHTDLEASSGAYPVPLPAILGHEGAGIVAAVGAQVTDIKPGNHVICSIATSCGQCFYCKRATPILCEPMLASQKIGAHRHGGLRVQGSDGPIHHFLGVSSFAEYCVVSQMGAVVIPPDIPFDAACLLGCSVLTGVGAVQRIAQVQRDESVVIVGCGPVGLNVIQGARMAGAYPIIAVDLREHRLDRAREMGATHVHLADGMQNDIASNVMAATQGRGADHVFEAASIIPTLQLALDCARPGGQVTILGKIASDHDINLKFGSLLGEKIITRSSLGGGHAQEDFPLYVREYLKGSLKLNELIDNRISLDQINIGLDNMENGNTVRTVLVFD